MNKLIAADVWILHLNGCVTLNSAEHGWYEAWVFPVFLFLPILAGSLRFKRDNLYHVFLDNQLARQSSHELGMASVWIDTIGTFRRVTRKDLYGILWMVYGSLTYRYYTVWLVSTHMPRRQLTNHDVTFLRDSRLAVPPTVQYASWMLWIE